MKQMKVLLMLLACFSLGGCALLPQEENVLPPPLVERQVDMLYETAEVTRGNIAEQVTTNGVVTAEEQVDYYFNIGGLRLLSLEVKAGDTIKAGDLIAQAQTGDLEYRIEVQKRRVRLAEIMLEQAKRLELESRELELEIEQLALAQLEKQLADCILLSRKDGVVLFADIIKDGDLIEAYKVLATVAVPDQLAVYAQSAALRKVRTGMPVSLTAGEESFSGTIVFSSDNLPSSADSRYRDAVIVKPEELPAGLRMGDLVRMQVTVNESTGTLLIPKRALRTALGQTYVQVLDEGVRKEYNVETGIETTTQVEIISGLSEGMQVILK